MKTQKIMLFAAIAILILLQLSTYAQQDSISQAVKKYWKKVDQISTYYVKGTGITKKFSDSDIDTLTKIYYKAISDDPVGYNRSIDNERDQEEKIVKENSGNFSIVTPRIKSMRTIRNLIINKYGKNFSEIISVPYYLKVKVISDSGSIYEGLINSKMGSNPHNILRAIQANLFVTVEDVIKGSKYFKAGQNITISYLTNWISESKNFKTAFEKGKSYFIPLRPWDSKHGYSKLTLYILPDNNYSIYPIENGIILTPGNYFGIGESSNWEVFKNNFIKKYILN